VARKLPNFIQAYLAFTAESESPEDFHKWCAVSIIGGAMRRRCFTDMGYFLLYPNLFVVLVSPPGRCKKSTAMRIARSLLGEVPDLNFTTDSVTRERMILDMSQSFKDGHSSMTAFSSEFASLLTSSGMDMVVFLTDIFDSPNEWSHRTKVGGTNKIKAPCLNLIGATTPDWIAKSMPLDTVGIGLTSRIIFVYQDKPRVRPAFPKLSPEQLALQPLLVHDLQQIAMIDGEYLLAPEAKAMYEEWYQGRIENPNDTGDPRLNGYFERKPMHLLKLCMIVAASFTDEKVISEEHFKLSLQLMNEAESKMPRVFASVGKNPFGADMEEVIAYIAAADGEFVGLPEILSRMKHSLRKDELTEVLDTLVVMGVLVMAQGPKYKMNKGAL
jgi:hypothetical protein